MPSHCDVLGCDLPATDAYLLAVKTELVEFGICRDHMLQLRSSGPPRVVSEIVDVETSAGRIMLVLSPPQDLDEH